MVLGFLGEVELGGFGGFPGLVLDVGKGIVQVILGFEGGPGFEVLMGY